MRSISAALRASLLVSIAGYRRLISPLLPPACRFHPSCSHYASDAIARHGVMRGTALAARRLARCHPWCEGGIDPVPHVGTVAAHDAALTHAEAIR